MQLPPPVEVDLAAIARRHGLPEPIEPLPEQGIFNSVYRVGDGPILRVPRNDPFFIGAARKELVVVPVAHGAGIRTPAIVVADTSCELVPVPYAIYERAPGETLDRIAADPAVASEVWRELGRDLALLHAQRPTGELAGLECEALPHARALLEEVVSGGHLSEVEGRWLSAWLETLAQARPAADVLVHGDIQSSNVMATTGGDGAVYAALIDWGGCGWADAAYDFAGIPLRAVPAMLDGYVADDDDLRARIVERQLQLALFNLRRGPQPGRSWAERPATMLVDVLRFFADAPPGWADVAPPR
jgi:aminoglycoside phosphotransferase (APT) family kinase protein